jgi:hypothetical protein
MGAIGPFFEIQVLDPKTFKKDPIIEVVTSSEVVNGVGNVMGLLVPGVDQWFPTTTRISSISSDFSCPSSSICGVLQIEEFTSPDGGKNSDIPSMKTIQFAIVQQCNGDGDCPSHQACNSNACQQCVLHGPCNP